MNIAEKSQQDNQWRAEKQADRENTIAMQDAGVEEITSNPELYVKYLDMQGDNPTYSAGNIALVMFQDPEATVFGTAERWKTLNRGVIDQERSKGVKIFARNTLGRGYRLTDAYDIRQTQGRDLKKVQLKDDSKEMSIALRAVLRWTWTPRAFPISCAASLASSGTRRTCPVWRSCTRAGTPSSGGAPWTKSRG